MHVNMLDVAFYKYFPFQINIYVWKMNLICNVIKN